MMGLSRAVQRIVCLERRTATELRAELEEERVQNTIHRETIVQLQAQLAVCSSLFVWWMQ